MKFDLKVIKSIATKYITIWILVQFKKNGDSSMQSLDTFILLNGFICSLKTWWYPITNGNHMQIWKWNHGGFGS